jgi:hypothetical protein
VLTRQAAFFHWEGKYAGRRLCPSINEQALVRILRAVNVPADLDRSILWRDLVDCVQLYSLVPALSSRKRTRNEMNSLQRIEDIATKLRRLLSDDEIWGLLESAARRKRFDRVALTNLIETVKSVHPFKEDSDVFKGLFGCGSSFERLVSKDLRKIYKDHFHVDPTISRRVDGKPQGSYLSFVDQILREFNIMTSGKPYSKESIITAFYGKRTGRTRQRLAGRPLGKSD